MSNYKTIYLTSLFPKKKVVIFTFCFKPNPFWWRGVGGLDDVGRWVRATPASRERNERDLWVKALKVGVASAGTVTPLCPQPSRCNAMSSELRCPPGKLGRVIWTHSCPLLRLAGGYNVKTNLVTKGIVDARMLNASTCELCNSADHLIFRCGV